MSLVQACADAQSAITRARSLFGATGGIDVPNSATEITTAAQTATAGRDRTVDMADGVGMPAYRDMVDRSIPPLTTAATSDSGLTTRLVTAAALTNAGATQLDSIAAQTRTISATAPTARTAADQRAILTALRGQLQQASQVVQTTQQQAGGAATQIHSLKYPKDTPASSGDTVQGVDDAIAGGEQAGVPLVQAAGFGHGGAPLDPAPTPTPPSSNQSGTVPFLPAYEQALTAPGPAVPPGGPPLPFSPPQNSPASAPPQVSAACQAAVISQQEDQEKKILADVGKGAVAGGLAGVTLDGVGALPGLISGGAIGGIGGVIDWATSPNPLPPACK
jgi:hypothetical protein